MVRISELSKKGKGAGFGEVLDADPPVTRPSSPVLAVHAGHGIRTEKHHRLSQQHFYQVESRSSHYNDAKRVNLASWVLRIFMYARLSLFCPVHTWYWKPSR